MQMDLPEDLVNFLDEGRQLVYDPTKCEAGTVMLYPRDQLRLRSFNAQYGGTEFENDNPHLGASGCYRVDGVDLIASCSGDYGPEGLLIWFPGERCFGVWDCDHDQIFLFESGVTWSRIAVSAAKFINAQWAFDDLEKEPVKMLVPWPRYPFVK